MRGLYPARHDRQLCIRSFGVGFATLGAARLLRIRPLTLSIVILLHAFSLAAGIGMTPSTSELEYQLIDADSGEALPDVEVIVEFWDRAANTSSENPRTETVTSDGAGWIRIAEGLQRVQSLTICSSGHGWATITTTDWRAHMDACQHKMYLHAAPRFFGIVVDAVGAPVADATVSICEPRTAAVRLQLTTNAEGKFAGAFRGEFLLEACARNFAPTVSDLFLGTSPPVAPIRLTLTTGVSRPGRVVDSSGAGVPDAEIMARWTPGKHSNDRHTRRYNTTTRATTDARGYFLFSGVPEGATPHVHSLDPTLQILPQEYPLGGDDRFEIVVSRAPRLQGFLVTSPGADRGSDHRGSDHRGSDHTASIPQVLRCDFYRQVEGTEEYRRVATSGVRERGSFVLGVHLDEKRRYSRHGFLFVPGFDRIEVEWDGSQPVTDLGEVKLVPSEIHTLSVVDPAGHPIPGVEVTLLDNRDTTDARGEVNLRLVDSPRAWVGAQHDDYENWRQRLQVLRSPGNSIIRLQPAENAAIAVKGRVLDEGGDKIAGARVEVRTPGRVRTTVTDHNGAYYVPSCRWGAINVAAIFENRRESHSVSPTEGDTEVAVDITIDSPTGVHGRVIDAQGRPLARVQVAVARGGSCWTRSDGEFELETQSGVQQIHASLRGRVTPPPTEVTVERGSFTYVEIVVEGPPPVHNRFSGIVINETGEPVASANLSLTVTTPAGTAAQYTNSNARGEFEWVDIPAGELRLHVRHADTFSYSWQGVHITDHPQTITLDRGGVLVMKILIPEGHEMPDMIEIAGPHLPRPRRLRMLPGSEYRKITDGCVVVSGLEAGTYCFRCLRYPLASSREIQIEIPELTAGAPDRMRDRVEIEVEIPAEPYPMPLWVLGPDGKGIQGVSVYHYGGDYFIDHGETDADGQLQIAGHPGEYHHARVTPPFGYRKIYVDSLGHRVRDGKIVLHLEWGGDLELLLTDIDGRPLDGRFPIDIVNERGQQVTPAGKELYFDQGHALVARLPVGLLTVRIRDPKSRPLGQFDVVIHRAEVTRQQHQLSPLLKFSGRVEKDGQRVGGGLVSSSYGRVEVGEEGVFELHLPIAGSQYLTYSFESSGGNRRITQLCELEVDRPLVFGFNTVTVAGELVDSKGEMITERKIVLAGTVSTSEVTTDGDGRFEIKDLVPDIVRWRWPRSSQRVDPGDPQEIATDGLLEQPWKLCAEFAVTDASRRVQKRLQLTPRVPVKVKVSSSEGTIPGLWSFVADDGRVSDVIYLRSDGIEFPCPKVAGYIVAWRYSDMNWEPEGIVQMGWVRYSPTDQGSETHTLQLRNGNTLQTFGGFGRSRLWPRELQLQRLRSNSNVNGIPGAVLTLCSEVDNAVVPKGGYRATVTEYEPDRVVNSTVRFVADGRQTLEFEELRWESWKTPVEIQRPEPIKER